MALEKSSLGDCKDEAVGHGDAGAQPGSGGCTAEEFGPVPQQENKTILLTVGAM